MGTEANTVARREGGSRNDSNNENSNSTTTTTITNAATEKATPLPLVQMAALSLVLLSESVCSTMLLPFVGLYVTFLQNYSDTNQAGKASGILVGCFMAGSVASSKLWGALSDTYGRRLPMMVGLFAGAIAMFFFGLAPNVYVCCFLRFAHGFCNGNVLVAKTVIADITDRTNEAKGFALVSIMWGTGSCIGPVIGGFLYDPALNSKLGWLHVSKTSFLGRHPAFLPSFVIFLYTISSLVITALVLKETNVHRKPLSSSKTVQFLARHLPCLSRYRVDHATGGQRHHGEEEKATDVVVLDAHEATPPAVTKASSGLRSPPHHHDAKVASRCATATEEGRSKTTISDNEAEEATQGTATAAPAAPLRNKLTYMQAMRITPTRNVTIFYVLLSASDMTYLEILPLWAVAERQAGGLDYFSDRVALILLICSVPSVVANVFFQDCCRLFRNNYTLFWMISTAMYTINTLIVPQANKLGWNSGLLFIIAFGIVRQVGMSWAYSLVHMLTAKSAPVGAVGATYGISQSFASMTRCVIPFFVAPLFAWSISEVRPFPFDYHMLFLFSALCSATGFVMSAFLRITRNSSDDAIDAEIAAEAAAAAKKKSDEAAARNTAVMAAVVGSRNAAASSVVVVGDDSYSDEDGDDGVGGDGAYFSLVASFCTNPLEALHMAPSQLEQLNREGRAEMRAREGEAEDMEEEERMSDEPAETARGREEVSAPSQGDKGEQSGSPGSPGRNHVIRARTAALLASLRTQQVESHRVGDEGLEVVAEAEAPEGR